MRTDASVSRRGTISRNAVVRKICVDPVERFSIPLLPSHPHQTSHAAIYTGIRTGEALISKLSLRINAPNHFAYARGLCSAGSSEDTPWFEYAKH